MPSADGGLRFGYPNLYFLDRLRQAHPDTEEAMQKQRKDILQVRPGQDRGFRLSA